MAGDPFGACCCAGVAATSLTGCGAACRPGHGRYPRAIAPTTTANNTTTAMAIGATLDVPVFTAAFGCTAGTAWSAGAGIVGRVPAGGAVADV